MPGVPVAIDARPKYLHHDTFSFPIGQSMRIHEPGGVSMMR